MNKNIYIFTNMNKNDIAEEIYKKLFKLIRAKLSNKNKIIWDKLSNEQKNFIIINMLKKDLINFKFLKIR